MVNKIIEYDVELLSTKQKNQYTLPTVFTNDLDSVEFRFNITDTTLNLALATADVLLYMHDGSFFQNTSESGVTIEGNTVKYLLKENEGNHSGTSEVQFIVKNGGPEYASQLYKFHIQKGLESVVATEVMIHDWTTLTRTAQEYIDEFYANEVTRQSTFDTNESTRATTFNDSETSRGTTFSINETTRQSSEDIRVANENTRIVSESDREASEVTRIANEESRLAVEAARVEAEDIRSEFYTGFDSKLEATQMQTVNNTKQTTDLEKRVANVNVNQEATQTVETNADIASLPVNAGNGALDARLEGFTATQLIKNGDFSDGTTGWIGSTTYITNNQIRLNTSVNGFYVFLQKATVTTGDKIFVSAYVKHMGAMPVGARLFIGNGNLNYPSPAIGVHYDKGYYSGVLLAPENNIDIGLKFQTLADELVDTVADNVQAINLTQTFGAGNEPSKEVCDIIFDTYFNGTKSFTPGRVKSVGKNLLDYTKDYNDNIGTTGPIPNKLVNEELVVSGSSSAYRGYGYTITVKPNTIYKYSFIARASDNGLRTVTSVVWEKVSGKSIISASNKVGPVVVSFDSKENKEIIITFVGAGELDATQPVYVSGIQLEEGTTATPYEPYTETLQYIEPVKLNRVPNGVADEITANGDFVQRVKEYTLTEADIGVLFKEELVDVARTIIFTDMNTTNSLSNTVYIPEKNYVSYAARRDVSSVGGYTVLLAPQYVYFTVEKDIYQTVTEAKTALAGTKIYYQLAEPIIHPNVTSGNLIAHPKGTVYFEQFQANAGMYASGISISNLDLPIKSLERLFVVDWMTGEERDLDVSKSILTATTVKHPELVDGDLVFFTYEFSAPSPNGSKTLSFYDSRYTIKDSVTGAFFKWDIKVTNGVPNIVLKGV